MALFSKNKTKTVEDKSIRDKSKFVVVGFTLMVISFFALVGGEIFTTLKLSEQKNLFQAQVILKKNQMKLCLIWQRQAKR